MIIVALAICTAASRDACAWGGRVHMDIARAAADSVPDEMAAWRDYGRLIARYSIQPDLWKGDDPGEGPRHYFEVDRYKVPVLADLPPDYAAVPEALTRRVSPADGGLAPWAILNVQGRLSAAMASNQWTEAARLAAAEAHYVGDIHQPLHTTAHYDGWTAQDAGVHLRWEEQMPRLFWRGDLLKPVPAQYLEKPWGAVLQWIANAYTHADAILRADRHALKAGGGDLESRAYFDSLWEETQGLFVGQANAAATDLGSLWYTAWVNAGRPAIPPPPRDILPDTVWPATVAAPRGETWPFVVVFGVLAVLILFFSLRRRAESGSDY